MFWFLFLVWFWHFLFKINLLLYFAMFGGSSCKEPALLSFLGWFCEKLSTNLCASFYGGSRKSKFNCLDVFHENQPWSAQLHTPTRIFQLVTLISLVGSKRYCISKNKSFVMCTVPKPEIISFWWSTCCSGERNVFNQKKNVSNQKKVIVCIIYAVNLTLKVSCNLMVFTCFLKNYASVWYPFWPISRDLRVWCRKKT